MTPQGVRTSICLRVTSMNAETQERGPAIHLYGLWNDTNEKGETGTAASVRLTLNPYGSSDRELLREFRIGDEIEVEIKRRG